MHSPCHPDRWARLPLFPLAWPFGPFGAGRYMRSIYSQHHDGRLLQTLGYLSYPLANLLLKELGFGLGIDEGGLRVYVARSL